MAQPLFVFGVARSGTNLVAGMLNAHSRIALALDPLMPFFKALRDDWVVATRDSALKERYPADCALQDYYFEPLAPRLLDLVMAGQLTAATAGTQLISSIAARAAIESPGFAQSLQTVAGATYRDVLDGILQCIVRGDARHPLWCGTKEVWTSEFIPVLARAYPDARFILIRRDPRGVLASLLQMMKGNPTQAAHTISYMRHWRKEIAVTENLLADRSLHERLLLVHYEELVSKTQEGVERLAAFLGVEPESGMLNPVMGEAGKGNANSSYGVLNGISSLSIERWREVLEPRMQRTIEYVCGPEMWLSGYLASDARPHVRPEDLVLTFEAADRQPGSWRSDTGSPSEALVHEARRWALLEHPEANANDAAELRHHFLFTSLFQRLINLARKSERQSIHQ